MCQYLAGADGIIARRRRGARASRVLYYTRQAQGGPAPYDDASSSDCQRVPGGLRTLAARLHRCARLSLIFIK